MKLTYYGTAAGEGWPGLFCNCELCNEARRLGGKNIRTRSQALVNNDLLIDLPPDTYMHSLVYGLDLSHVDSLLVTHSHSDHFNALDLELLREPYAHNRPDNLQIFGNQRVSEKIQSDVPNEFNLNLGFSFSRAIPFKPFKIKDYTVVALLALHDKNEECLFYRISCGGKTILYAHDTGFFPDETIDFLKSDNTRLDLVSLDCTMQQDSDGKNHMGLIDAAREKQRLMEMGLFNKSTVWVVNHFSHNGKWLHGDMEREANRYGFFTTYDGMVIEI